MKIFLSDIIPRIQRYSLRLDSLTLLTDQKWVSVDEMGHSKVVFIFRTNNQLIISENGKVKKGSWELLANHSLMLDTVDECFLFTLGFFDNNVLALKLDSTDSYAFFLNETQYSKEINTVEDVCRFLDNKYLKGNLLSDLTSNICDINYSITRQYEDFDFIWGNYRVYEIKYEGKINSRFYKGASTGKYFYLDHWKGKMYFSSLDEVILHLYHYKKRFPHY